MKRVWRVRAFGAHWDCYSLMAALILIQSFKIDYGPLVRVSVVGYVVESVAQNHGPFSRKAPHAV